MGVAAGSGLLFALALLGCSEDSPLAPQDVDRLTAAEEKWAARGYTDYTIEVVHNCSCPPSLRDRARIEVVGGSIRRVFLLGTLATVSDERRRWWRTVEELFQDIRNANDQPWLEHVTFSLDPINGFPTFVHWAAKASSQELEDIIIISNPQPLIP